MENESKESQEESRETGQNSSEQNQEKQWMDAMKGFSDEVTEIEAYARKQGDFVHTISEIERQIQEELKMPQGEKLEETKKGQRKDDTEFGNEEK